MRAVEGRVTARRNGRRPLGAAQAASARRVRAVSVLFEHVEAVVDGEKKPQAASRHPQMPRRPRPRFGHTRPSSARLVPGALRLDEKRSMPARSGAACGCAPVSGGARSIKWRRGSAPRHNGRGMARRTRAAARAWRAETMRERARPRGSEASRCRGGPRRRAGWQRARPRTVEVPALPTLQARAALGRPAGPRRRCTRCSGRSRTGRPGADASGIRC